MERSNPFWSLAGFLAVLIFMVGLAAALLWTGGLAFSPGPLTAQNQLGTNLGGFNNHAEFEDDCSRCHQPLVKHMDVLCLECHNNVAAQIQQTSGLHGKLNPNTKCRLCHPDHEGRDFSPAHAALPEFDHQVTRFNLVHHQVDYSTMPLSCDACHDPADPQYAARVSKCLDCHTTADIAFMTKHQEEFGQACLSCHDGADRMVDFEHINTGFPLEGKHQETACTDCHVETREAATTGNLPPDGMGAFARLSRNCADCHAEPSLHAGVFTIACQDCHTPEGWSPARLDGKLFDHAALGFSLQRHNQGYDGLPLTCRHCHMQDLQTFDLQVCTDCHTLHDVEYMSRHIAQVGQTCLACHDGVDRMHDFDHNRYFVLDGRHAEITCADCHGADPQTAVYKGLPGRCSDCHAEPAIHAGFFGLECQDCHSTTAWTPAFLKEHSFPLEHGANAPSECALCHPTVFTQYTCYGCHEHEPARTAQKHAEEGISGAELERCVDCHPTGLKEEGEHGGEGEGESDK